MSPDLAQGPPGEGVVPSGEALLWAALGRQTGMGSLSGGGSTVPEVMPWDPGVSFERKVPQAKVRG